jgi:WD40 repeat protein
MWDSKTGDLSHELKIHSSQVSSITLSPGNIYSLIIFNVNLDLRSVLSNSKDNTLRLTDLRTHEIYQTFQ